MTITIDQEKCIGCGTCEALAPEVFKLTHDGKIQVLNQDSEQDDIVQMTVDSCPTQAIILE
ncbi:MAG: ferredoxin [bacterium]